MITNKLKINDSKTEFIVFKSPQLRCDLSGLSVNVGESQITQSLKLRRIICRLDYCNFLLNNVPMHKTILPSMNVLDLGIYMSGDCTFNFYISSLSKGVLICQGGF